VVDRLDGLSDIAAVAGRYTAGRIRVAEVELEAPGSTSAGCLRRTSGNIDSVDGMQLHSVLAWPGAAACLLSPAHMLLAMAWRSGADSLLVTPALHSFQAGHIRDCIRCHTLTGLDMTFFSAATAHPSSLYLFACLEVFVVGFVDRRDRWISAGRQTEARQKPRQINK